MADDPTEPPKSARTPEDPLVRAILRAYRLGDPGTESKELHEQIAIRVRELRDSGDTVVTTVAAIRALVRGTLAPHISTWKHERLAEGVVTQATTWTLEEYFRKSEGPEVE